MKTGNSYFSQLLIGMLAALPVQLLLSDSYYAVENLADSAAEPRRGFITGDAIPVRSIILAPDTNYRLWRYEPDSKLIGTIEFTTPRPGRTFEIPSPEFRLTQTRDSDGDDLSDEAEWIIGTDPNNEDSDMDGGPDGAEVAQGNDPLDGLNAQTGIVLSRETRGAALDVAAFNNLVVLALGERGIGVFNVFNTMEATIIAQVDTAGFAQAVAYGGGSYIAVADGSEGIAVVNLNDGPNARIAARFRSDEIGGGDARCAAVAGDLGIVGTSNGRLVTFGLSDGILLDVENLGSSIDDVVIQGGFIYVLQSNRILRVYHLAETIGTLVDEISFASSRGGWRKRIGIGLRYAYISNYRNFDVVDISDPTNLNVVGETVATGPFGFRYILPDGSGTGVAVVGLNSTNDDTADTQNIYLYSLADPTVTTDFLTEFVTPGRAQAVALYNNLAYVADENGGMQVLNYRSPDFLGIPPQGTLSVNVENNTAIEGSIISLTANVTDDVAVRNVEFFANGQPIGTDGSFPFEIGVRVPQQEAGNVEYSAIVRDTANNSFRPEVLRLSITEDDEPPVVSVLTDLANQIITDGNDITVELSISDNVSVRTSEVIFLLDGKAILATRTSGNTWSIKSPGVGHYEFQARIADGANNTTLTEPIVLKVRIESISRELSVFNAGPSIIQKQESISREMSLFNAGPSIEDRPEAISRETSIENQILP